MKTRTNLRSHILCAISLVLISTFSIAQCPGVTAVITSNSTTCSTTGTIEFSLPAKAYGNFWEIYWDGPAVRDTISVAHTINVTVPSGNHWFYIYQWSSGYGSIVCSTPNLVPVKFQIGPILPLNFEITSGATSNCSSIDGSISLENAPLGAQFSVIDKNNTVIAGPITITSSTQTIATGLASDIYRIRYGSCNYLDRAVMVKRPASCYGTCVSTGANLVVNGEFEDGNTGYFSNYPFYSSFASFCGQFGMHSIGSNASTAATANADCSNYWRAVDRNGNNGKFLLVDPSAATGANDSMWRQIIPVCQNTDYVFLSWVKNVFFQDGDAPYYEMGAADPEMSLNINGVELYNTGRIPRQAMRDSAVWFPVFVTWNSGSNTTANISIANKVTGTQGNDIALDGIFFGKCAPSISIASNPGLGQCIIGSVDFMVTSSEANFQWQESLDGGANWTNVGANTNLYTDNLPVDAKRYRVYAASSVPGLNEISCRTVSGIYTIAHNGVCYVLLPLKFTSFKASYRQTKVDLFWTVSDIPEGRFEVERKATGTSTFKTIGGLDADKNTRATVQYEFTDSAPLGEMADYRIKYTPLNGKVSYSRTITAGKQINKPFHVTVSPRPFTDKITISIYSKKATDVQIKLRDGNGMILKSFSQLLQAGATEISMSYLKNLPPGIYFLEVRNARYASVEKLIKY